MQVLDQHVEEEKDAEFMTIEEVDEKQSLEIPIVEQLLDEADKLNKVIQEPPESPYHTKLEIKVVMSFFTCHFPELKDQIMHDSEETADIHEGSDFDLQLMPNDNLRSVSGFYTADSNNTHENEVSKSDHIFQDDNASTECLSLQDHMDYIYKEVSSLYLRLRDMESSIVQQVSAKFKSSLPAIVTDSLKEQLPSLLSDALKDTPPQLLKDAIKNFILKSITEELPYVEAEGEQPSTQVVLNEKAMVVHNPEEKKEGTISMEDDSDDDDLDKQPLSKRFNITTPIHNPIPLNTFTFGTTSSKFSPTPPREPTPPRDLAKGKEIGIMKEKVNELVTYQEKGGSILKMPKLKSFITLEGTLSQEELNNQIKKLKRISDLKAQKGKSKQELRNLFNQATLKARAKKWTEHEAKKA
nr:hypothetical protein [Tanacetum cinerariifolium]